MKTLAKLAVITVCLLSIYLVSQIQSPELYDIMLDNVEALGAGEIDSGFCGGSGQVDCYGNKVAVFLK